MNSVKTNREVENAITFRICALNNLYTPAYQLNRHILYTYPAPPNTLFVQDRRASNKGGISACRKPRVGKVLYS